MNTLTSILQDRENFTKEIFDHVGLKRKLIDANLIAAISFAIYGAIIGSQHSLLQGISSAIKLPILFLLTSVICMPTLYIFSSFFGSKRSLLQNLALLATGTALMGVALVGFAPVTVFFLVTTKDYDFFKLLNVCFFAISGLMGILFFHRVFGRVENEDPANAASRRSVLLLWLLLYAFVGTQLGWTLRPFFGSPGLPFEMVRQIGGNFYLDIFESVGQLTRGE